jgi:hypothetical protein
MKKINTSGNFSFFLRLHIKDKEQCIKNEFVYIKKYRAMKKYNGKTDDFYLSTLL